MSAASVHPRPTFLLLNGKSIEVASHLIPSATDTILLLHEALGSVSYWRDFPRKLANVTSSNVLLYSRPGHGNSEGTVEERNQRHYLSQVETVIPSLLAQSSVNSPILYGHSEGAGIALLYASTSDRTKALILESPHIIPEKSTYLHIRKMAAEYPGSKLQQRLALYHQDADAVFYSWVKWATATPEDSYLPLDLLATITCPVLVLQGANDNFGSTAHLAALQASIPNLQHELYDNTGHLPHREQTDSLLNRVARFLTSLHHPPNHHEPFTQPSFSEDKL